MWGSFAVWRMVALLVCVMPFVAQARVVVRTAKELETGRTYEDAMQEYQLLSSANVIFDRCSAEQYPSIATDKAYLAERFPLAEKNLVQAYHDNYVKLVGYPPLQNMVDESVARIRALQQSTVNDTALMIQDHGCGYPQIELAVRGVFKAHATAEAIKNRPPEGSTP